MAEDNRKIEIIALRILLEQLNISRAKLSNTTNINNNTLSSVLAGQREFSETDWMRIVRYINDTIKKHDNNLNRIKQYDAACNNLKLIEQEVIKIVEPIGLLSEEAQNYIRKDNDIYEYIDETYKSIIFMDGGIYSGKSTMLRDFKKELERIKRPFCYIDFSEFTPDSKSQEVSLYKYIVNRILTSFEIEIESDVLNSGQRENDPKGWARNVLIMAFAKSKYKKCGFVIFNSLDSLYGLIEEVILDNLINFSYELVVYESSFSDNKKLTIISDKITRSIQSYEDDEDSAVHSSQRMTQCENISVKYFDVDITKELVTIMGLKLTPQECEQIIEYFGGQPFLIHITLYNLFIGKYNIDNFRELPEEDYMNYKVKMNRNLNFIAGSNSKLKDIIKHVKTDELNKLSLTKEVKDGIRKSLKDIGFLDKKDKIIPFHKKIF